jgi:hypothetical protein
MAKYRILLTALASFTTAAAEIQDLFRVAVVCLDFHAHPAAVAGAWPVLVRTGAE